MINGLVSSYSIIAKLVRDFKMVDDEGTLIEWIAEAIDEIGMNRDTCRPAVAFIQVQNFTCKLPTHCRHINQIARNNSFLAPQDVVGLLNTETEAVDIPVPIDEEGKPITAVKFAYYRPFFDLVYEYNFGIDTFRNFKEKFTPVRLAKGNFFTSEEKIHSSRRDEYTLLPDVRQLRFNFPSGQIALSYLRQYTDEMNFPMIPDHIKYRRAIFDYIVYKISWRDFYNHVQGSETRLTKSESDWLISRNDARTHSFVPNTIDEYKNMTSKKLLPTNDYNRFFE